MLFMSALVFRDARHSKVALLLVLVNAFVACSFLGFTPAIFDLPYHVRLVFRFLDVFQMPVIWLLVLSLFDKDFRLSAIHLIIVAAMALATLMERLVAFGFISSLPTWWALLVNGLTLALVVHMIFVSLRGRDDDLIESRRRSRIYIAVLTIFSALSATVFGSILFSEYQKTVHVISIWPSIVLVSFWLAKIEPNALQFYASSRQQSAQLNARDEGLLK